MKKKVAKGSRKTAKPVQELRSYASIYAATLARQVAAELKPRHPAPKKSKKAG
jgi:hypothetical protein